MTNGVTVDWNSDATNNGAGIIPEPPPPSSEPPELMDEDQEEAEIAEIVGTAAVGAAATACHEGDDRVGDVLTTTAIGANRKSTFPATPAMNRQQRQSSATSMTVSRPIRRTPGPNHQSSFARYF